MNAQYYHKFYYMKEGMLLMSKSLMRAIEILDCFSQKPELTINELVEMTGISKTTVFRLATSLEDGGLLIKEKKSSHNVTFRLSLKFLTYSRYVKDQMKYNEVALPYMKKLNEDINELVHLTVVEGNSAVYIETFSSTKPLRLVVKAGARAPLYAGSAPKLLLATMSDTKIDNYLNDVELKKVTENTIADKGKLKKEIEKIRRKGYSISYSENFDFTIGFSYPIHNYNNEVVAALGISIPEKDYSKEKEKIILSNLEEVALEISKELGYSLNEHI